MHNTRFKKTRLAQAIGGAVLCTTLSLPSALLPLTAHAQQQSQQQLQQRAEQSAQHFEVPAGDLGNALSRFAADSGVVIYFDASLTQGKQTRGLSGDYNVEGGLRALLSGSGLSLVKEADGSFRLVEQPADVDLPLVRVEANWMQETAYGPVQGIAAARSATGTKTDTPIIETPQSISVVSSEEFKNYGARNFNEALAYTPGVSRQEGADRTTESLRIRGFTVDRSYRDGSKYQANLYDGQQELYGLERLEVLKGPSSILYGVASPGGMLNAVSKRPTREPLREVNIEAGSFDRRQISADFSDALDEDGVWSYRLTMLHRDSDTFIDHVPDDRTYIAPALKWQPNESTSLTLLSEYQRDQTAYVYGLPTNGTILPNQNGQIPRERFTGEPGYDEYDNERYSIGYLFEHDLSNSLHLRHSLRTFQADRTYDSINMGQSSDQRTYTRIAQDRRDASSGLTSDTSLQYDWEAGNTTNTSLIGIDYIRQRHETERYNRTAPPLDLFDPVYGSGDFGEPVPFAWSSKQRSEQVGLYAQNQMKIADKWVLLLGGRQDWTETETSPYFGPTEWTRSTNNAFTGRVGGVYLADNGLAPFLSYSQSFEPTSGTDRNGNRFDPTRGEQYELGVRYQPEGWDTMLTATAYELTQENVSVTDPVDTSFQTQIGEVRSRGVELEAKTAIGPNANLVAAYAYTDARTTKSSPVTPAQEGKRAANTPYNQFSLWGDYRFGDFGLPGLKVGGGVRYVGPTRATWIEGEVPAFTLIDTRVSYETGPWVYALNATNLTDKTYIESCTYDCFYGEPRSIIGSVSYQW
ncbi:TonB-dependent siderophore receptor [Vreelandella nigrificans]|uniref:TonB-dependent siderophore receptor n=1 Tax=Vreelandella nigrificans TaxID=2042704 RepID=A0A2A4HJP6_9GAMM|nr:TonB-dependent siderophore receptor [Halomonas nigrificans]PCF94264.1 TonB-dependent siderophore receptor [Halomonas nigrificans]